MRRVQVKHWQDVAIGLLGAWFAASPWLLGLHDSIAVVATSLALGLALLLMAVGSLVAPRPWEHWAQAAFGAIAAVSPWVLGFSGDPVAWRNAVAVGLTSTLLALWAMLRERPGLRKKVLHGTAEMAH